MKRDFLKNSVYRRVIFFGVLGLILTMNGYSYAQKSKEGLHFQVPEGWPIEKRGGILAPIPTEEYVMMRFKAIEEEFETIKDELSDKFIELQADLENMEADLLKEIKDVRSQSSVQGEANTDLTDISSDLKLLKSELDRLDRKITDKVREMEIRSEQTVKRIESSEGAIKGLQTQIYKLVEEVDYINEQQKSSYNY